MLDRTRLAVRLDHCVEVASSREIEKRWTVLLLLVSKEKSDNQRDQEGLQGGMKDDVAAPASKDLDILTEMASGLVWHQPLPSTNHKVLTRVCHRSKSGNLRPAK